MSSKTLVSSVLKLQNRRIKIIGYYDNGCNSHENIGDEQYKYTFIQLFNNKELVFIDCDDILSHSFNDTDIIVVGGGGVLCDYFVDKILKVFERKPNKLIGVSVDLPYTEILLKTNKLDRFDYIFLRNRQDYVLFNKYYVKEKIGYIPDISCLLKNSYYNIDSNFKLNHHIPESKKILGIITCKKDMIDNTVKFINHVFKYNYYVLLLSFNPYEDSYVNEITKSILINKGIKNFTNVPYHSYLDTYSIVKKCDVILSSRFHGCLFALHTKTPFIPFHDTCKMRNLIKDIGWPYVSWNSQGIISYDKMIDSFDKINSSNIKIPYFDIDIEEFNKKFDKIIRNTEESNNVLKLYSEFQLYTEKYNREDIVKYLSYEITGKPNSEYNYGLLEKLDSDNFNFIEEISWMINDQYINKTYVKKQHNLDNSGYNITFKDQDDTSGVHRSGWKYVYNALVVNNNINSNLYLDLNVDETFHWNNDYYTMIGLIPYKKNWLGFIHHTFDTNFTDYNCSSLFENPNFLNSLNTCQGFIVMTSYLQNELIKKLIQINRGEIPVYVIYHPTEEPIVKFNYESFKNSSKTILHVGTWLRNVYFFYKLKPFYQIEARVCCNPVMIPMKKIVLKGKENNNYFPSAEFSENMKNFLIHKEPNENNRKCSHHTITNNWHNHLYEDIQKNIKSVELIEYMSNFNYDDYLSRNIVFVRIVDGSAINTLIECIARNTPIIINKHPSVVELLGEKYPLYFDDDSDLIIKEKNVKAAHLYLKKFNKKPLMIETFINELNIIISEI